MNIDFGTAWSMKAQPSDETLGARVRALRTERNLSQAKLGKAIGMTQTAIAEIEKGKVKRPGKLLELAEALSTTQTFLLHGPMDMRSEDVAAELDRPSRRELRVKGYVRAGGKMIYYDVEDSDYGTIRATNNDPPKAVAAVIMGKSLGRFFDHWHVVYNEVRSPVTDDMVGELCVVWLKDGRVLVKRVVRAGRKFDLESNDPTEETIKGVEIESAALVTDVRRG